MVVLNAENITLDRTPRRATYSLGLGALEEMKLTTWSANGAGHVRVRGRYFNYCGNSAEHVTVIDESMPASDYEGFLLYDVADSLVEVGLSDWEDPCS
jgi:hypothetical protein